MSGIIGSAGRSGVIGRTHGGIKEMDMWRLTGGFTGDADPLLDQTVERVDTDSFTKIGTGMSVSSGKWTFPSTGIWCVDGHFSHYSAGEDRIIRQLIQYTSNDGSSWTTASLSNVTLSDMSSYVHGSTYLTAIFDITDTSNQKVGFQITKATGGAVTTDASTNENITSFIFTRLGDT